VCNRRVDPERDAHSPLQHLPPVTRQDLDNRFHATSLRGFVCKLLYGSGLRGIEARRLRVKDLDFERLQITVRDAKGQKDRVTILPKPVVRALKKHLVDVKQSHELAMRDGYGGVELPDALARKYPRAPFEWGWQYIFPAAKPSIDPRSGIRRRHHLDRSTIQRAVRRAMCDKRTQPNGQRKPCTSDVHLRRSPDDSSTFLQRPYHRFQFP
jgi:integrase